MTTHAAERRKKYQRGANPHWLLSRKFDPAALMSNADTPAKLTFETRATCRAEDALRQRSLNRWVANSQAPTLPSAFKKAEALWARDEIRAQDGRSPALDGSLASSLAMRRLRRGFCGQVLKALSQVGLSEVAFFTLIPLTGKIEGVALAGADGKKLLEQFRSQLNRLGLNKASGWLIASVHGDYDPISDEFQLHLHVLAVGQKAEVVGRVRGSRTYRSSGEVKRPILRQVANGSDLPWQVTYYLAQSFWPSRPRLLATHAPQPKRARNRIPEPRHAEWLMWMNRQSFSTLIWLHNCRNVSGRLVVSE